MKNYILFRSTTHFTQCRDHSLCWWIIDSIWIPTSLAVCTVPEKFLFLPITVQSNSWLPDSAVDNYQVTTCCDEGAILTFPATYIWLDDATVQSDKVSVGIHTCEPCCGTNELASSLPTLERAWWTNSNWNFNGWNVYWWLKMSAIPHQPLDCMFWTQASWVLFVAGIQLVQAAQTHLFRIFIIFSYLVKRELWKNSQFWFPDWLLQSAGLHSCHTGMCM